MDDNDITAIVGWPTEPEMAKYRMVASAAEAAERERWATAARLVVAATPEQLPLALDALADVLRA
jgi:hypothetical protein